VGCAVVYITLLCNLHMIQMSTHTVDQKHWVIVRKVITVHTHVLTGPSPSNFLDAHRGVRRSKIKL
jgi:hypothetical protein